MMTAEQLKASILQLAMEGKLVEQSPEEGTGEELYQKIQAEKATLVKEGKITKQKSLPEITDDEKPFDIPESWRWTYIGEIFDHNTGKALNGSNSAGKVLSYITTSNLYWNRFELDKLKRMPFTDSEIEKCTIHKGDLLVCEGGDYGRAAIWPFDYDMRIQNHIHRLRPYVEVSVQFYYYLIRLYKLSGRIKGKGIGIQGLSSGALHKLYAPLPPLREQYHIVKKIEELMPFVNQYATVSEKLDKLNSEFPDQVKKSILQLAVEGKLVEQRLEEGTGYELCSLIQSEKSKSSKVRDVESKIYYKGGHWYETHGKQETCIDKEIPFEIPESWTWRRFGDLMINRDSERIPLSVAQRSKLEKRYNYYGASGVIDKVDRPLFCKDLLLIGEDGANLLNRSTPIAFIAHGEYWVNNHAHVLDTCAGLSKEYIALFINAIDLSPYVTGTAQPKMNQQKMNSILVSVPPRAEQERIVQEYKKLLPFLTKLCVDGKSEKKLMSFF